MSSKSDEMRKNSFGIELQELPPGPTDKLDLTFRYMSGKSSFCFQYLKSLKVEVITFVYMFAYVIRSVSSMTMIMDKVCRVNIGYPDSICDDMNKYPDEKAKVEILANNYHLCHTLIEIIPSSIISCFVGPWSDQYGRKLPLIVALIGIIMDGIGATMCAVFLRSRVEFYLLPAIMGGLSGGFVVVFAVVYSYVSDLTEMKSRTFKYALMEVALGLAVPLGTLAGGFIFNYHGYVPVFATSLAGHLFGLFWVIVVMDETRGLDNKDSWETKLRSLFSCHRFIDSFKATMKRRPNRGRMQILLMILAMSLWFLSWAGTSSIAFLYVHNRYGWGNTKYSTVSALFSVVGLFFMLISVPILTKYLKVGDPTLGIIGSISTVAKLVGIGFSTKEWIYYLANFLGMVTNLTTLAGRARISKVASKDDLGKVFSFLSTAELLFPILATAFVAQIFNWSVQIKQPGITYLVLAGVLVFTLVIFIWLACLPSANYEEMEEEATESPDEGDMTTKPELTTSTPISNKD